jgi:hypothetical protein
VNALNLLLELLKYASVVVGSASGLIGATTETKDKTTGKPNAAGKWVISIIIGSVIVGVASQAITSAIQHGQDRENQANTKSQQDQLKNILNLAKNTTTTLTDLHKSAQGTVLETQRLADEQKRIVKESNKVLSSLNRIEGQSSRLNSKMTLQQESQRQNLLTTLHLQAEQKDAQRGITRNLYPLRPLSVYYRLSFRTSEDVFRSYVARLRTAIDNNPSHTRIDGMDMIGSEGVGKEIVSISGGSPYMPSASIPNERYAGGLLAVSQVILEIRTREGMRNKGEHSLMSMACHGAAAYVKPLLQQKILTQDITTMPMSVRLTVDFGKHTIVQTVDTELVTLLGDGGTLLSLADLPGKWLTITPHTGGVVPENIGLEVFTYRNGLYLSPHNKFEKLYRFSSFERAKPDHPLYDRDAPVFYMQIKRDLIGIGL